MKQSFRLSSVIADFRSEPASITIRGVMDGRDTELSLAPDDADRLYRAMKAYLTKDGATFTEGLPKMAAMD